ncbi:MAG: phosphopentomutase [Alphaproteobacteria bacterium]|nr:phosphopentomutase [Alphaproteobacteria bacterium]MBQ8677765.1 phosphopentomutase [Alphaproteobacteria bacterium]
MSRAIILMMDSFGIGGAPDAEKFNNVGANTFAHIAQNYPSLQIPNLLSLGLAEACEQASGEKFSFTPQATPQINIPHTFGHMKEISRDKDTVSGHWEMAGLPNLTGWGHFKPDYPSFPQELIKNICREARLGAILGNKAASGTVIIQELGEEHIRSGYPIFYTSADSNMQIAAHEKYFGLEKLYALCEIAYKYVKPYNIGRIIARPFIGEKAGSFTRTTNRRDYTAQPFGNTLLDDIKAQGGHVWAIGAINDIFAHRGITKEIHTAELSHLWDATIEAVKQAPDFSLIFTNFEDFDMLYGHRRNVAGYAQALEYFDKRLPELLPHLKDDDLVFITADHGNDPTYQGTDHTREQVPVIVFGFQAPTQALGLRNTYADLGQSVAKHLGISPLPYGETFL